MAALSGQGPDDIDETQWPSLSSNEFDATALTELKKALFQARIDLAKSRKQAIVNTIQDQTAHQNKMEEAVYSAFVEVVKGMIERTQSRAQFVQTAAAAIGTIYTGILAFTYNATVQTTQGSTGAINLRLPTSGIIPAVFLGLSIVLATVYLAYLTRGRSTQWPSGGSYTEKIVGWLNSYIEWVRDQAFRRAYFLRAAVVSLGVGVMFLPIAYVGIDPNVTRNLTIAGVLLVFILPWLMSALLPVVDHFEARRKKENLQLQTHDISTMR